MRQAGVLAEIDITPEMIEAGAEAYCLFDRGDPPEDVAHEIYRRMASLDRRFSTRVPVAFPDLLDASLAPVLYDAPN